MWAEISETFAAEDANATLLFVRCADDAGNQVYMPSVYVRFACSDTMALDVLTSNGADVSPGRRVLYDVVTHVCHTALFDCDGCDGDEMPHVAPGKLRDAKTKMMREIDQWERLFSLVLAGNAHADTVEAHFCCHVSGGDVPYAFYKRRGRGMSAYCGFAGHCLYSERVSDTEWAFSPTRYIDAWADGPASLGSAMHAPRRWIW